MKLYIECLGLKIPAYGLMIALGVVIANMVALWIVKKNKHDINDFIILEAYTFLGAFFGAKILYILVSFKEIDWKRIMEPEYFNQIMQGGFVFYGGLIGGLLFAFAAGRIHKIKVKEYVRSYIFLIPVIHGFGRVGCFFAGCCYGVPYNGVGAVMFPTGSLAPSNVWLFPVQLVEALLLILIAVIIVLFQVRLKSEHTIEIYLGMYGIIRFFLEFYRYDEARGMIAGLSTSQWISILLVAGAVMIYLLARKKCYGGKIHKELCGVLLGFVKGDGKNEEH